MEIDSSSGNTIGGTVAGAADVISGNVEGVEIYEGDDNVVAGDKIGTDATGTVALANGDGVEIDLSSGNTIGGTSTGAADVISGNGSSGVELDGSSDNLVEGDFIGTDASGTQALGNGYSGVIIQNSATNNTIGGTSAIAGNLISKNNGPGVVVGDNLYDKSVGNQITANRIFGNTGQAIDLGDDGVTDNGTGPRDGPNDLPNFPIIFTTADGQTEGWLGGSESDATYRIDVFASAGSGPGGAGGGTGFPRVAGGDNGRDRTGDLRSSLRHARRLADRDDHGDRLEWQHIRSDGPAPGRPGSSREGDPPGPRTAGDLLGCLGRWDRPARPGCRTVRL